MDLVSSRAAAVKYDPHSGSVTEHSTGMHASTSGVLDSEQAIQLIATDYSKTSYTTVEARQCTRIKLTLSNLVSISAPASTRSSIPLGSSLYVANIRAVKPFCLICKDLESDEDAGMMEGRYNFLS